MSSKSSVALLFIAMAFAAGGAACGKDKAEGGDSGAAAVASTNAASSASAATNTPPATAESDPLPSHSDVAKIVRAEVTKQNYKTELDKLEKEIDQP